MSEFLGIGAPRVPALRHGEPVDHLFCQPNSGLGVDVLGMDRVAMRGIDRLRPARTKSSAATQAQPPADGQVISGDLRLLIDRLGLSDRLLEIFQR